MSPVLANRGRLDDDPCKCHLAVSNGGRWCSGVLDGAATGRNRPGEESSPC
jgi:hypothetical protein